MQARRRVVVWTFVSLLGWLPTAPRAQAPQPTGGAVLFEGARLITGDGSPPIENSAFIIENGRFTRIGRRGELQPPSGATRVDLTGKTVMPGIIDGHNHIGYDHKMQVNDWRRDDSWGAHNFTYDNVMDDMRRFAYFGVVATYDAGYGIGEDQYRVIAETLAGKDPNAARYIGAGTGITTPSAARGSNMRQSTYSVRTAEQGRLAVQDLAHKFAPLRSVMKVPILKYWVDDTVPEVYTAVIEEARKHNMLVVTGGGKDNIGFVRAGGYGWAHGPGGDDATLAALKELQAKGQKVVMLGFTMINNSRWWRNELFPPNPLIVETIHPELIRRLQEQMKRQPPEFTAKYRKATEAETATVMKVVNCKCIPVGFGSDGGGRMGPNKWPGWSAHLELENMVAAGMTPAQVIVAATKTSAENLMLDDLGTVSAGKSADFIVLDANPLENILNTRRISRVYMRGKEVDRSGLRAAWAKFWQEPRPGFYTQQLTPIGGPDTRGSDRP